MPKKFITPRTEAEAARILAEKARGLDPEQAGLYDEGLMRAMGAVVVLPEVVTNPRISLFWKARLVIGNLLTAGAWSSAAIEAEEAEEDALFDGPLG